MSIKLICGQFENIEIKDGAQLCFLDPPDNEGRKYENYSDRLSDDCYEHLLRVWIDKACRETYGPVFVSVAEKWIPHVERGLIDMRIPLIQRIWWHYRFGQAQKNRYALCVRPIYWLNNPTFYPDQNRIQSVRQKIGDKRATKNGKIPPNIWEFSRVCGTFHEKKRWHTTQHPQALMERIILGHSKPGDLVVDGFIGSGTTAYVCNRLGRNCIGVDTSQFYLDKVQEHLDGTSQNSM